MLLDISILYTLRGLPDKLLELPLIGGVGGGNDAKEGDVRTFGCDGLRMLAGRLLAGGGGGAFPLFDRGRPTSVLVILGTEPPSSSTLGDRRPVSRGFLDSDTS